MVPLENLGLEPEQVSPDFYELDATPGVEIRELVRLCAFDQRLFEKTFFPETARQEPAVFHREIDELFADTSHRYVALKCFRGSGKTSKVRMQIAKRVSYGISRTIMVVSNTADYAAHTLQWLRSKVERNTTWATTFGLSKGDKWNDSHIIIKNAQLGIEINVVAMGITGQTRGLNLDDWRPDLILIDDPCDEENTATPEARQKTNALIFGSLKNSLSPESESPAAKMVLLQTPLNQQDVISECESDSMWASRSYGCFDHRGESTWPARWATERLLREKQGYIDKNLLHIWTREMECKVISAALSMFKSEWVRYIDVLPSRATYVLAIDPVPPPSDRQVAKGLADKDFEAHAIVGFKGKDFFVPEVRSRRGHNPDWTLKNFFELVEKWDPVITIVEGVAYQRTLKWLLDQAMAVRGRYVQVEATVDNRPKSIRISQGLSGPMSQKRVYFNRFHMTLLTQLISYPSVVYEDELEAVAMAMKKAQALMALAAGEEQERDEEEEDLGFRKELVEAWRGAP